MPQLMKSFLKRHKLSKRDIVFAAIALVAIVAMVTAVAAANGFYSGSFAAMIGDSIGGGVARTTTNKNKDNVEDQCKSSQKKCVGSLAFKCAYDRADKAWVWSATKCTYGCDSGTKVCKGAPAGKTAQGLVKSSPDTLCMGKYPGSVGIAYAGNCSKYSTSATYVKAGDVDLGTNALDPNTRATCCMKREEYNSTNTVSKCPAGSYCEFNVKAKTKKYGASTLESTYNTDCSKYVDAKKFLTGAPYQKLVWGRCLATGVSL